MKAHEGVAVFSEIFDAVRYFDDQERELQKLEPAWAKAALFFRTGHRFGHDAGSRRAQSLSKVYESLEVLHRRHEKGNTLALLSAVALCAEENLPLPTWLAMAFLSGFNSFTEPGGVDSLDAVFHSPSLPTRTPKKAATARLDWELGRQLWFDFLGLINSDEKISSFDMALEKMPLQSKYGVAKTKARALILMIEKNQNELLGKRESLSFSRIFEKRRKP